MSNDIRSLAHTKWNCKYHVVYAPKYRREVFYGERREAIPDSMRDAVRSRESGTPFSLFSAK